MSRKQFKATEAALADRAIAGERSENVTRVNVPRGLIVSRPPMPAGTPVWVCAGDLASRIA